MIIIGFIAGLIARVLSPGPNEPKGFILTTALGIAGAFVATFIGQSIGWYRLDQGAGLIAPTVGALVVLFIWNRLVGYLIRFGPGQPRRALPRPPPRGPRQNRRRGTRPQHKEAEMGLADILTGMMNGPRGQRQPSSGGSGGGMSPIMMALLGLLAYKALKGRGGQTVPSGGMGQTSRLPPGGGTMTAGSSDGGLGDILGGLF